MAGRGRGAGRCVGGGVERDGDRAGRAGLRDGVAVWWSRAAVGVELELRGGADGAEPGDRPARYRREGVRSSLVAADVVADAAGWFPAGAGYMPAPNPTRMLDVHRRPWTTSATPTAHLVVKGSSQLSVIDVGHRRDPASSRRGPRTSSTGPACRATATSPTCGTTTATARGASRSRTSAGAVAAS